MKLISLLILAFSLILSSCNFSDGGDESSDGGGLFSNHTEVENLFVATAPTDNTYLETQTIDIILTHPFEITVTGTPRIPVTLDSGTVYADYVSGSGTNSLTFRFTVTSSDDDTDGISYSSTVDLNGGSLTFDANGVSNDAAVVYTTPTTSAVLIDTTNAAVSSVVPIVPVNTFLVGQVIQFLITYDDTVYITGNPQMPFDIGGSTVNATYISGDGSATLIFQYTVTGTDVDADGIDLATPLTLNGGTIKDTSGIAADLVVPAANVINIPTLLVDGDTPYVSSITPAANGAYIPGEFVDFTLNFSESVTVAGATPRVNVDVVFFQL